MGWWTSRAEMDVRERVALAAQNAELRARVASQQATIDWLSSHVNTLTHEKAAMMERLLELRYPVPTIARENERPARPMEVFGRAIDDPEVPPHLQEAMRVGRAAHRGPAMADDPATQAPRRPGAEEQYANSIGVHQADGLSFEDMGDEAAAAQGIAHDGSGNVVFSR